MTHGGMQKMKFLEDGTGIWEVIFAYFARHTLRFERA